MTLYQVRMIRFTSGQRRTVESVLCDDHAAMARPGYPVGWFQTKELAAGQCEMCWASAQGSVRPIAAVVTTCPIQFLQRPYNGEPAWEARHGHDVHRGW